MPLINFTVAYQPFSTPKITNDTAQTKHQPAPSLVVSDHWHPIPRALWTTPAEWGRSLSSWWFQPIWKICSSKWESLPNIGVNIMKYLKPPCIVILGEVSFIFIFIDLVNFLSEETQTYRLLEIKATTLEEKEEWKKHSKMKWKEDVLGSLKEHRPAKKTGKGKTLKKIPRCTPLCASNMTLGWWGRGFLGSRNALETLEAIKAI